ncbi:MAG: S1C family serine protease [Bacteriovoracia bacterium]
MTGIFTKSGFRRAVLWAGLFAVVLPRAHAAFPALTPAQSEDLPDLVEKIEPAVANVSAVTVQNITVFGWDEFLRGWGMPRERKNTSLGSGFLVDTAGYILTNNHVVENASEVFVSFKDKKQLRARIVGRDPKLDLALLQVLSPLTITPVKIGDSEKVRIAQPVVAIGNPFGLQNTVTMGIISAKNRTIGLGPLDNFLQTDASINPGNSGGPLFNLKGEVIGINTLIFSRTGQSGGLGFAIPVNEATAVMGDLKKYGRVPRPWLGILSERVTPQLRDYYGLARGEGVLIYNLVRGAPAQRAGIKQGDILIDVGGVATTEPLEVERALLKLKPKESVSVKLQRGSKQITLKISLEELPPDLDHLKEGII